MSLRFLRKTPLVILPTLVYFLFYFNAFYRSELFDPLFSIPFIAGITFIDMLFFSNAEKQKWIYRLSTIAFTLAIIIWFGLKITHHVHVTSLTILNKPLFRAKIWLFIFIALIIPFHYIVLRKKTGVYFLNIFWLILTVFQALQIVIDWEKPIQPDYVQPSPIHFKNRNTEKKLTLLLITDEYSSPDEIIKYSSKPVYAFSETLTKKGWIVKNKFPSIETSSIHSFSSILHYNLSAKQSCSSLPVWEAGFHYLYKKPPLIKDLLNKNIKIQNYGIFHMGEYDPVTRMYFYPLTFSELIFSNSLIIPILQLLQNKDLRSLSFTSFLSDQHNQLIIDSLPLKIKQLKKSTDFIYAHLFMPHGPYTYKGNSFNNKDRLHNYIDYWYFTNDRILEILQKLDVNDDIRIIITGDHGLRKSPLEEHATFTAFWGFNKEEIDQLRSVQDIGSLINNNY